MHSCSNAADCSKKVPVPVILQNGNTHLTSTVALEVALMSRSLIDELKWCHWIIYTVPDYGDVVEQL